MNLTPKLDGHHKRSNQSDAIIKGGTLTVWQFLVGVANKTAPPTKKFQVSRKEIQDGTGIGSLNTIDNALEDLESCNLLCRYSSPGSNDGQVYELLTLEENPVPHVNRWHIVSTFRQVADSLERDDKAMTLQQIVKWSRLTYRARRLLSDIR